MPFPSTLSSFNRPTALDRLNSPSHSDLHNTVSSALGQVEAVIGRDGNNSVLGTIIGDLRSPGSGGGGHVQTANKGGTGQTSFNKGDILVAQSSSVISKVAISSVEGYALIIDSSQSTGVRWGIPGNTPTVRTYSSVVSIWTKPSTLSYAIIEVVGGGGNGANGVDTGVAGDPGGGGGGGGYSRKIIAAANLPLAASVYAGTSSVMSYFGSVISATGGSNASGRTPGGGGTGTGGDINIKGSDGSPGSHAEDSASESGPGGSGGNSFYGGGGAGGAGSTSNGSPGGLFGGGGGGGGASGNAAGNGANGAGGIVIITEY